MGKVKGEKSMTSWIITYYDAIQDQKMWVEIFADTTDQASDQFQKMYGTSMPIVNFVPLTLIIFIFSFHS